ncbi:MAG: MBL fold metallo-hydrolase [Promethearchaeota archaeon]|nr:MAG: MBL fold metallo-hydrolase [Candidatus Lokiarchaeota archaeon]
MKEIFKDVFHVGDSGCSVYLVNTHSEDGLILIDCGMSLDMIKKIKKKNLNPMDIKHCILTHFHIDHIGACHSLKEFNNKVKFYAHNLDADPIEERGHDYKTAASWYGVNYKPVKLEKRLKGELEILRFGSYEFKCIHTPGHTPGSLSILIEIEGTKILFGQDIHGPFMASFGSNLKDYQKSMQKLLDINADILCEGHFGIFQPAEKVRAYIKGYMEQNR